MKHCKHCNVDVNDTKDYCPLCFNRLEGERDERPALYLERENNNRGRKNSHILRNIFLFLAICTLIVCTFVDYQTGWSRWSVIVDFSGRLSKTAKAAGAGLITDDGELYKYWEGLLPEFVARNKKKRLL